MGREGGVGVARVGAFGLRLRGAAEEEAVRIAAMVLQVKGRVK